MFQELMCYLRTLEQYYKTAHWSVRGPNFYGDHLLFDRLSEDAGKRIDQVAEKSIGVTGNLQAIHLPSLLKLEFNKIKSLTYEAVENRKYFEDALQLELSLLDFCEKAEPSKDVGIRNMLGDICDESQGRIYLIKQRLAK